MVKQKRLRAKLLAAFTKGIELAQYTRKFKINATQFLNSLFITLKTKRAKDLWSLALFAL